MALSVLLLLLLRLVAEIEVTLLALVADWLLLRLVQLRVLSALWLELLRLVVRLV